MNTRLRLLIIVFGALIVAVTFTFPLWRPLFVNEVVNEVFPGLNPDGQIAFEALTDEEQKMYQDMLEASPTMAVDMAQNALMPDNIIPTAEQAMPSMTDPITAAVGVFVDIDLIHKGIGTATIYQLADNSRILRFEDFKVTNGPDLHVLLTVNPSPKEAKDVGADYIELGVLKGNVGNQNYSVPNEVDLSVYKGVVIYCLRYGVVFSTAKLG